MITQIQIRDYVDGRRRGDGICARACLAVFDLYYLECINEFARILARYMFTNWEIEKLFVNKMCNGIQL